MAWSNFAISAVVVGSAIYLMKTDVRAGSAMLRQNLKTIRTWMSEEANAIKRFVQDRHSFAFADNFCVRLHAL